MSRLNAIRSAVATIVTDHFTTASETVTLSADPDSMESLQLTDFPFARIIFVEEEPERLAFKQERRRVTGQIAIAMFGESVTRETVDSRIEGIRDAIFADETLGGLVDDISAEAGAAISNPDDGKVYGTLDISTEELF